VASQIDIVNWALIKLGSETRITALTDNNKPARIMSPLWDVVRQAELRAHFWSFAIMRASLPSGGTAPTWGYANNFPLPTGYLRMVQVNDIYAVPSLMDYVQGDNSLYAIEGKNIVTDLGAPLKIRYIADVADPGQFDALYSEGLAAKLAFEACESITQSNTKKAALAEDYKAIIRRAVLTNAIERPPQSIADDSWQIGRL
jgi:hypothetical protein